MTQFLRIKNNSGSTGPQGPQGPQGYDGDIGVQGIQGNIGPQGNQGDIGNIGPQGIQGIQGLDGHQGLIGHQGSVGFQGSQGNIGPNGMQGFQGSQGSQGYIGDQGIIGPNGSVQLSSNFIAASQACSSTTYINLSDPATEVSLTTGTSAIILLYSNVYCSSSSTVGYINFSVSGSTIVTPDDVRGASMGFSGAINKWFTIGTAYSMTGLNPGINTFTLKYKVSANTVNFSNRRIIVIPQ